MIYKVVNLPGHAQYTVKVAVRRFGWQLSTKTLALNELKTSESMSINGRKVSFFKINT